MGVYTCQALSIWLYTYVIYHVPIPAECKQLLMNHMYANLAPTFAADQMKYMYVCSAIHNENSDTISYYAVLQQAYTGLKTLYLENNAIEIIEGLEKLLQLRSLYLSKNIIHTLHGLQHLTNLETLDVSSNNISTLEGLACLPSLRVLNVSSNKLQSWDSIAELEHCEKLTTLDLSDNRLSDDAALQLVMGLPLALLCMMGNPVVSSCR
jgi:hypothetical protein